MMKIQEYEAEKLQRKSWVFKMPSEEGKLAFKRQPGYLAGRLNAQTMQQLGIKCPKHAAPGRLTPG